MSEEAVFRWISVLGFPIVSAVALAYALYRVGIYLAGAHVDNLKANTEEMKKQTAVLDEIKDVLPKVCLARCPYDGGPQPRDNGPPHDPRINLRHA